MIGIDRLTFRQSFCNFCQLYDLQTWNNFENRTNCCQIMSLISSQVDLNDRTQDGAVVTSHIHDCICAILVPTSAASFAPSLPQRRAALCQRATTSWLRNINCRIGDPSGPRSNVEQMLKIGSER